MANPTMFGYTQSPMASYAASDASSARSTAREASRETDDLEDRLERLSLVCMGMWSLIQDKTNLTEEDLMQRVRALDMVDGVEDRKATRSVVKCPKCHRTMNDRHMRCLYCGAEKQYDSAFDQV